ncbi:hypothetical protein CU669_12485 [Paramagnetospirillum kuznetsovii]|uniref:Diguanylate cyclase response regulator n=1 Tax=Paramagnetospirillum kuznetsovii TaxID=2053833 RepID=A0A364NWT5_9PROT|nr:GGDEF domain-containing response regulator [Paramagnetospirillum kuznetsovii]RAU21513.1 hypothetical protein CU669_12485 [Paramagnetospirillum kuznetsovii]
MDRPSDFGQGSAAKALEVLLVDGDMAVLDRVRALILQSCGGNARVDLARTADEALAKLAGGRVDICFADFVLAKESGFQLAASRDGVLPHTAFVLLADAARKEWVYSALRHGAQDCVVKDKLDTYEILKTIAFSLFHKSRELELTTAALRDPLTGLGNRALFNEQAQVLIEQARRNNEQLAVLFMDIDGLKPINDALGHAAGDELLKQVSDRIRSATRKSDVVARMGGDEFAAILPRIQSPETVAQVTEGLMEAVDRVPYTIGSHSVRVGLSCGSAVFPDEADSIMKLLAVSDARMYAAKARKRVPRAKAPNKVPQTMKWLPNGQS